MDTKLISYTKLSPVCDVFDPLGSPT